MPPVTFVTVVEAKVEDPVTVRLVAFKDAKVVEPRTESVPVAMALPMIVEP